MGVRWAATLVAIIGAFGPDATVVGISITSEIEAAVVLLLYGVARTIRPIRSGPSRLAVVGAIGAESALCVVVVALTGGWGSPYLITVGSALILAGLLGGLLSLGVAVLPMLVVGMVGHVGSGAAGLDGRHLDIAVQRLPELVVMGLVGVYARRAFTVQANRQLGILDRLQSANEVHRLLLELHARAAEQPGLVTLRGVVSDTAARLRNVLSPDVVALLLRDPTTEEGDPEGRWQVAMSDGVSLLPILADEDLPDAARGTAETDGVVVRPSHFPGNGFDPRATSGLYASLRVRDVAVGLLAVERRNGRPFTDQDSAVLEEVAQHAAIAIDNARLFGRLRFLGAEEERGRIARDLHDRVGQSLIAAAFAIDRLAVTIPDHAPEELQSELTSVAREVRWVSGQIREKLSDLRSGPTKEVSLTELLDEFATRVAQRSEFKVDIQHEDVGRLPLAIECEVWRIAFEAIVNAERHSYGTRIGIRWAREGVMAVLEVHDDGRGLSSGGPLGADAYGLLGMRERAELIGATLILDSEPGKGTTVRLRVPIHADD